MPSIVISEFCEMDGIPTSIHFYTFVKRTGNQARDTMRPFPHFCMQITAQYVTPFLEAITWSLRECQTFAETP